MNPSSNNITNEQNLLINLLQTMYNDNIQQINTMNNSINNLRNANTQIRNILVQILNSRQNTQNTQNRTNTSQNRSNSRRNTIIYHDENNRTPLRNFWTQENLRTQENNRTQHMQDFLEPVDVYPTLIQVEAATRITNYANILNPINRSCPISLEIFSDNDMVSVIRFCGHIFNTEQLRTWFRSNCRCPVCRYDIRSYETNQDISSIQQTDSSNNLIEERPNRQPTYLDYIFNSNNINDNLLNDNLINEVTNLLDNTDANALLTLFTTTIRRTG
jgi:hypothetical protein